MKAWHSNLILLWQTDRVCRVVVSILQIHFMWEERKTSWDNEMKFIKPGQNGCIIALGSNWLFSFLGTRGSIPRIFLTHLNFFTMHPAPKHGHFFVSFHTCPHHLKLNCKVRNSLLQHSCYCRGLVGCNQPPCCRICFPPLHFASCNTLQGVFKGSFRL